MGLRTAAAIPGAMKLLMVPMRFRTPRRLTFAFGWLVKRPIDRQAEDSYLLADVTIRGIERDLKWVIKGSTSGMRTRPPAGCGPTSPC
jgi:hypothetical protein